MNLKNTSKLKSADQNKFNTARSMSTGNVYNNLENVKKLQSARTNIHGSDM